MNSGEARDRFRIRLLTEPGPEGREVHDLVVGGREEADLDPPVVRVADIGLEGILGGLEGLVGWGGEVVENLGQLGLFGTENLEIKSESGLLSSRSGEINLLCWFPR